MSDLTRLCRGIHVFKRPMPILVSLIFITLLPKETKKTNCNFLSRSKKRKFFFRLKPVHLHLRLLEDPSSIKYHMALFVVIVLALLIAAVRSLLEVINFVQLILFTILRGEPNPPAPQRPGPRRRLFD